MAFEGDLSTMPVRQLLAWLVDRRATGQLSLSRGMVARRFHLRQGRVLLASSSEEGSRLGRLLIEEGLLDEGRLRQVLGSRGRSRARLGKALVEAGVVSADDLTRVLAGKVERLLRDALTWSDGRFHFEDAAPARRPAAAVATTVDLAALLERPPSGRRGARAAERIVPVADADVLEIRPLGRPHDPRALPQLSDAVGSDDDENPPAAA